MILLPSFLSSIHYHSLFRDNLAHLTVGLYTSLIYLTRISNILRALGLFSVYRKKERLEWAFPRWKEGRRGLGPVRLKTTCWRLIYFASGDYFVLLFPRKRAFQSTEKSHLREYSRGFQNLRKTLCAGPHFSTTIAPRMDIYPSFRNEKP